MLHEARGVVWYCSELNQFSHLTSQRRHKYASCMKEPMRNLNHFFFPTVSISRVFALSNRTTRMDVLCSYVLWPKQRCYSKSLGCRASARRSWLPPCSLQVRGTKCCSSESNTDANCGGAELADIITSGL